MEEVVRGTGGFSELAAGIGGKGEEFHYQFVGKVWRIEEGGDRKGGSGVDSSAESIGMEGIDRSRHGGIDKAEDCRFMLGDCRVDLEEEKCIGVLGLKSCSTSGESYLNMLLSQSCSVPGESHLDICLKTIRDKRRMQSSLHFPLCLLSSPQIAIDHEVRADFCRIANHKAYHRCRTVRFNMDDMLLV